MSGTWLSKVAAVFWETPHGDEDGTIHSSPSYAVPAFQALDATLASTPTTAKAFQISAHVQLGGGTPPPPLHRKTTPPAQVVGGNAQEAAQPSVGSAQIPADRSSSFARARHATERMVAKLVTEL